MSAGTPLNTRKRQLKKVKMVPHGPGGQMLRPAPKVHAPSVRQRAVSQERSYRSQGRAVEKVANRTTAYKRSRPYYYKRSEAFNKAADALHLSPAQKNKARHHTTDQIATRAYKAYVQDLWDKVQNDYPKGKRPRFTVDDKIKGDLAYVIGMHNKIHYSHPLIREFMFRDNLPGRTRAEYVPLHEFTHTRQRQGIPKFLTEGGAEIKGRSEARKLKKPYQGISPYRTYEQEVRRLRNKYGVKRINNYMYRKLR